VNYSPLLYLSEQQHCAVLIAKIWSSDHGFQSVIAVEYRDADKKMVVVHIRKTHNDFLMEYDGFAQKKRGPAMKHLVAQMECEV
jgi:hypothetical protein